LFNIITLAYGASLVWQKGHISQVWMKL